MIMRRCGPFLALLILLAFAPASVANPVAAWIGNYLLGKAADGVWDRLTNAPDVERLESRLREVELVLGELRGPIATLRSQIKPGIQRAEYDALVKVAVQSLEAQVFRNTEDIERLKARVAQLESSLGTRQNNRVATDSEALNLTSLAPVKLTPTLQASLVGCSRLGDNALECTLKFTNQSTRQSAVFLGTCLPKTGAVQTFRYLQPGEKVQNLGVDAIDSDGNSLRLRDFAGVTQASKGETPFATYTDCNQFAVIDAKESVEVTITFYAHRRVQVRALTVDLRIVSDARISTATERRARFTIPANAGR